MEATKFTEVGYVGRDVESMVRDLVEIAVTMVKELASSPGAGHDDTVFKLASDISADQTSEIDRMQQMLAELMFGPQSP